MIEADGPTNPVKEFLGTLFHVDAPELSCQWICCILRVRALYRKIPYSMGLYLDFPYNQ